MGTKQTHHRQSTQTIGCELVPPPELPLTKKTETYLGSTQTPNEIIYIIISMLDPLSCLRLSMTSHFFPKFFTEHPIACFSSKTKLNPQLKRLYYEYCCQSLPSASLPQFLALKNSDQLVEYEKTMDPMHDDYLVIDFSKKLNFRSIDLSETPSILFNWSDDYGSKEDAIERSVVDQFKKFFQSQTFPNVKKLVLNNLVYSYDFISLLAETFNGLQYLNIASYSIKSKFNVSLSKFTTINELEIMLPISGDFRPSIRFTIPIQLEKITFNGLQNNPKSISCKPKVNMQIVDPFRGTSLKIIIFKNGLSDDLTTLSVNIPSCTEIFISNTKGWRALNCEFEGGYSHLKIIHVSEKDKYKYPFIYMSPGGKLILNEEMCPNCKEFGVFDEDGNLQIIWRKQ